MQNEEHFIWNFQGTFLTLHGNPVTNIVRAFIVTNAIYMDHKQIGNLRHIF